MPTLSGIVLGMTEGFIELNGGTRVSVSSLASTETLLLRHTA
jgi:hypothetical protein